MYIYNSDVVSCLCVCGNMILQCGLPRTSSHSFWVYLKSMLTESVQYTHCFALLVRSNIQYRYLGLSGVTSQDVYLCLPGLPALKQNAQCKMLRASRGRVHSKRVILLAFLSSISVEPQLQAPGQILLCSTFSCPKKCTLPLKSLESVFYLFVFERDY